MTHGARGALSSGAASKYPMRVAQGTFMDPRQKNEITVQGIAASQGIAYGQVVVYIQSDVEVPSYQVETDKRIE